MAMKSVLSEYYKKGDNFVKENDVRENFKDLPENTIIVKVKRGSKMQNLMFFVQKSLKEEANRHMIFTGCGDAIEKTISCAEITKSKFKNLHQINRLGVFSVEEFWEPTKPDLDRLRVTREIPMIAILLCKDPLDTSEPGYQEPVKVDDKKPVKRKKKSFAKSYGEPSVKVETND